MIDPMNGGAGVGGPGGRNGEHDRLRSVAHQFEGIFVAQLFREMRATIPEDEAVPGQDMYTGLMDDALAGQAAERSAHGLGEALYRQLAARFNGTDHGNASR